MKKDKKIILILFGVALWLLGLFLLTPIVLSLTGRNVKPVDINLDGSVSDDVVFAIDKIEVEATPYRDVNITGWAFIEHDGSSPDKKIELILTSKTKTYAFDADLVTRNDLQQSPLLELYRVPEAKNGFRFKINTLMMENGAYKLYFRVVENDELQSIINTGRKFAKHNNQFEEILGGQETELLENDSNLPMNVKSYFSCNNNGAKVRIEGWSFLEDGENKTVPFSPLIKLPLKDGKITYLTTTPITRYDLVQKFENKQLAHSGFVGEFSSNYLSRGENRLTLVYDGFAESEFSCIVVID